MKFGWPVDLDLTGSAVVQNTDNNDDTATPETQATPEGGCAPMKPARDPTRPTVWMA